jgi:hypothetical protein
VLTAAAVDTRTCLNRFDREALDWAERARAVGFKSKTTGFFSAAGAADAVRAMLKEVWNREAIANWE